MTQSDFRRESRDTTKCGCVRSDTRNRYVYEKCKTVIGRPYGYRVVLKNAIDDIYPEWGNKPVGFVSHGRIFDLTR